MEVHSVLGPGLPEAVYQEAMGVELGLRGIPFESQPPLSLTYKGHAIQRTYRPDLLIQGSIVVELKAVEAVHEAHLAQLHSYLRMTRAPLGLLLNFHEVRLSDGIHRLVAEAGLFTGPVSVRSVASVLSGPSREDTT